MIDGLDAVERARLLHHHSIGTVALALTRSAHAALVETPLGESALHILLTGAAVGMHRLEVLDQGIALGHDNDVDGAALFFQVIPAHLGRKRPAAVVYHHQFITSPLLRCRHLQAIGRRRVSWYRRYGNRLTGGHHLAVLLQSQADVADDVCLGLAARRTISPHVGQRHLRLEGLADKDVLVGLHGLQVIPVGQEAVRHIYHVIGDVHVAIHVIAVIITHPAAIIAVLVLGIGDLDRIVSFA